MHNGYDGYANFRTPRTLIFECPVLNRYHARALVQITTELLLTVDVRTTASVAFLKPEGIVWNMDSDFVGTLGVTQPQEPVQGAIDQLHAASTQAERLEQLAIEIARHYGVPEVRLLPINS